MVSFSRVKFSLTTLINAVHDTILLWSNCIVSEIFSYKCVDFSFEDADADADDDPDLGMVCLVYKVITLLLSYMNLFIVRNFKG